MTKEKQRHIFLTVFLAVFVTLSLILALKYLLVSISNNQELSGIPSHVFLIYVFIATLNIVWLTAIFQWKKWGFFGFLGMGIFSFISDIFLGDGVSALIRLILPAILFGVLQIGKENKGWTQLE